ncbi:MAG: hypothetical protein OXU61_02055, partial [Gammaproteobacteria bacterium]|nr:hypothetical protein [Gammaproteobacteria bacterium]
MSCVCGSGCAGSPPRRRKKIAPAIEGPGCAVGAPEHVLLHHSSHYSPLEGESARRGRKPDVAPVGGMEYGVLAPPGRGILIGL